MRRTRETLADKGEENIFFHWYFKIWLLERRLLYIIGKVQWNMSARLCHFCVCCFRNFLQLIKPVNRFSSQGQVPLGHFTLNSSRHGQALPAGASSQEKQLLYLQISSFRRYKCLYNHTRKEDSGCTFFILVHVKLTLGIIMTQNMPQQRLFLCIILLWVVLVFTLKE